MNDPILEYYQKIKDGTITVGRWILLWYEIIIKGLENKLFFYDPKKARRAISFIETFCRHHEGALAPNLITLELFQKAAIAVIFGIVDKDGRRQFREALLLEGKKNGKTLLASAIAAYMTFADNEYGAEIYFTATKLQQASLCYNAFIQTVEKEPELKRLAKKRRSDIYIESTNTTVKPIAFNEKTSDGISPQAAICDEASSWPGAKGLRFYENLTSASAARTQPLILTITTSGYENDGIFDELMKRATAVLLGSSKETRFAPFLYMIDDVDKWNDINELKKSMPNLGVSVSVDYMLEQIRIAEGSLSKKAEFLVKFCNIKQNFASAWLDFRTVERATTEKPLRIEDFRECYCVGGIDLSKTIDLTSACVMIERDGRLYTFSRFWMPRERLQAAIEEEKVPYDQMIKRGFLYLSGENRIDWHDVFDWFQELLNEYHVYPLKVGYDRYSAIELVQAMSSVGFHMDDVWQGSNLTPVIHEMEGMMKDGVICIGNNSLLQSHLLNVALKTDAESVRVKPVKISKRAHIDGAAAVIDALTVRQKWYGEIGEQLKNKKR